MITPINGHVVVEPVVHESFTASSRETYDEVGVVIAIDERSDRGEFAIGDKVLFDSWLCAKYPKNEQESYWLVKYEDIRAYEKQIPE